MLKWVYIMGIRMGRRFIFVTAAIMLMGGFELAHAAYVIKLKNGNAYVTTRYWQDGGQVFFDTYGGVFGVDNAFVSKIELSSRSLPLLISASGSENQASADQGAADALAGKEIDHDKLANKDAKPPLGPTTQKEPLKKDEEVLKEYNELRKRSSGLADLPKYEVQALGDDIDAFRQKVSNSAQAELYKEEIDAMGSLRSAIDSYLKAAYP